MNMINRIAFISEHASPLALLGGRDSGGQNVYVAEVTRELAKEGCLVDVFTRMDDETQPQIVEFEPGIRVIHIKAGPREFVEKEQLLSFMPEFADNMHEFIVRRKINYDLLHANFFMSAMVASIIKQRLSIPYVVTFHALGLVRQVHQKEQDRFPQERCDIERFIVKDADRIIAECPQDREDLIRYYETDPQKITVIPCGYSYREFHPVNKEAARKKLGLPVNGKIIMHIGRMVARKGVDNIIRAMGMMKGCIDDVRLVIVGGESDQPDPSITPEIGRLQKLAIENNVTDLIIFAGRKSRELLKYYYSSADVFVTTPWYEPFGITPLEAMACGIPVIGSNVGGIKFSVKHRITGILVPPKNPQELSHQLTLILSDDQLRVKMAKNALKRVNEYFTWKKVAYDLLPVYKKVVLTHELAKRPVAKQVSLSSLRELVNETMSRTLYLPGS
jgi:glycosyltransferase involved in cell wall biosynthesis